MFVVAASMHISDWRDKHAGIRQSHTGGVKSAVRGAPNPPDDEKKEERGVALPAGYTKFPVGFSD
jgi:hypothetical protein